MQKRARLEFIPPQERSPDLACRGLHPRAFFTFHQNRQRFDRSLDDDPIAQTFPTATELTAGDAVPVTGRTSGMDKIVHAGLHRSRLRRAWSLWAGVVIAVVLAGPLLAAESAPSRTRERTPARSPKVDHAVMPAGGAMPGQAACSQCRRSACPQCRLAEGHHHGHAQCQHGLCPAHCPVRPDVFGFYGTRWRKWPGEGVVQASNNEAATPVRPPQTEVPGVDEESLPPDPAAEGQAVPPAASEMEPSAATRPAVAPARENAVPETIGAERGIAAEPVGDGETVGQDGGREDVVEAAVSPTAWRTFTTTPPRLAVQP
jgi:hypothetical protein